MAPTSADILDKLNLNDSATEDIRDRFFAATNLDLDNLEDTEVAELVRLLPLAQVYLSMRYDLPAAFRAEQAEQDEGRAAGDTRIWLHRITGREYAVAVDRHGRILGAWGPLSDTDAAHAINGEWEPDGVYRAWLEGNAATFLEGADGTFTDITLLRERQRDWKQPRASKV